MGSTVSSTAASATAASANVSGSAAAAATPSSVQPLLPTSTSIADTKEKRYHDSLQYHFFFPGFFIAGRVFHTNTLQQHSAWMYNLETGKMTELFTPSYAAMLQRQGDCFLNLESQELKIVD